MSGSFYIKARKHGKSLKIPIEEKHKYFNIAPTELYIRRTSQTNGYGFAIDANNIKILHTSSSFYVANGTGSDNQRIGSKVKVGDAIMDLSIWLHGDTMRGRLSHGETIDSSFKFRLMTVKFEELMSEAQIAQWYSEIFTYQYLEQGRKVQSVLEKRLTESNGYTGQFKIVADRLIILGRKHSNERFTWACMAPKQEITFRANPDTATNDSFKYQYTFLIVPTWYAMDVDATSKDELDQSTFPDSVILAKYTANIKYTYYDL